MSNIALIVELALTILLIMFALNMTATAMFMYQDSTNSLQSTINEVEQDAYNRYNVPYENMPAPAANILSGLINFQI